ncbi:MAG: ShlB/FhaC/HecB family hemolysin secretion/activation protein [Verrucomicrobia bacterium]|nr:ShlB/FhaC/HecB family hemolysin secretion/activation protein [Verrucomicrobiota bacterium]
MKCIPLLLLCGTSFLPLQISSAIPIDEFEEAVADQDSQSDQQQSELTYPVSQIYFEFHQSHPKQPPIEELEKIEIPFYEEGDVLYGAEMQDRRPPASELKEMTIQCLNGSGQTMQLTQSALEQILHEVYNFFLARNIDWTVVYIPNYEIATDGRDLRKNKDTALTIVISTPIVKDTSVKFVDPNNSSKEIDNSTLSQKICNKLPLSLPDPSTGYPGDFINSNLLNNYLHSLNRHPERRVDLEIGPTGQLGEVALDFVVTQKRPWHFYFNANNNVPKPIDRWQESVGFIHTQLTGNDDILKLNASSDSCDKFYSIDASYEAPFRGSIGTRWQLSGSYSRFLSAEFALPQNLFVGTQAIFNGEIITNIAQWDKLFLDFVADLQYRHIHNQGHIFFSSATKNFILPQIGLKAVQLKRETKLIASLSLQSTMSSLFWDVRKNLDNLGRTDLSPNWAIVQAGLYGSFYLEPLFQKSERVKHLANEIVVVGQLQNAFNQRLIPELEGILGGLYTIRGYPQSTVSGDNLYMGSFEYRFHLPQVLGPNPNACTKIFGKSLRWAPAQPKGETDWDFVIRAFYDVGQTTVNQRRSFERNYLIMGSGLGAELVVWQNIFIRGDWGHAFRSANGISSGHNQFYFSSTVIF